MSCLMKSETLPCSSRPGWRSSKQYSTTSSPPSWPWLACFLASWSPPPYPKLPPGSSQPLQGFSSMWRWWTWCQSCPQDTLTRYLGTVRGSQGAWHYSSRWTIISAVWATSFQSRWFFSGAGYDHWDLHNATHSTVWAWPEGSPWGRSSYSLGTNETWTWKSSSNVSFLAKYWIDAAVYSCHVLMYYQIKPNLWSEPISIIIKVVG